MQSIKSSGPKPGGTGLFVGTLSIWNPTTRTTSRRHEIYSNEELFVGRDPKRCQFLLADPFVSNKHIRIYTVIFDQDDLEETPPLVYAEDISLNGTRWNEYWMGKGNGRFLLSDGDVLRVTVNIHLRFTAATSNTQNKFTQLQQLEMRTFQQNYVITHRLLGSGAYGRVHMAFNAKTGRQFACKIVDIKAAKAEIQSEANPPGAFHKARESKFFASKNWLLKDITDTTRSPEIGKAVWDKVAMQRREARFLATLSHPNIITTEKIIHSSDTIYMFTELVTCGDLFSFLRYNGGLLAESTAALIIRQVLLALEYLHGKNIVHRDIKPDNILMTSVEVGGRIVLADFGCARVAGGSRMLSVVGTLEYCAPELNPSNQKGYTKAVDMWSVGCVTAVLLVGNTPFDDPCGSTSDDLTNLDLDMRALEIGSRPRDFVRRLLVEDETQRLDVKQALQHDWFTNKARAQWFQTMYKRAISGWVPRNHDGPVIVDLADKNGVQAKTQLPFESAARGFSKENTCFVDACHDSDSSLGDILPQSTKALISPTVLTLGPVEKPSSRSPLGILNDNFTNNPNGHSRKSSTDSTVKFVSQVKRQQFDRPTLEGRVLKVSSRDKSTAREVVPDPVNEAKCTMDQKAGTRSRSVRNRSAAHPSLISQMGSAFSGESPEPESEVSDQVYEEVCNPVTGKRKRLIYGRHFGSLSRML